jgi:hypothetical protein
LVRQPYEAISLDNWWPIHFHHQTVVGRNYIILVSIHFLA